MLVIGQEAVPHFFSSAPLRGTVTSSNDGQQET